MWQKEQLCQGFPISYRFLPKKIRYTCDICEKSLNTKLHNKKHRGKDCEVKTCVLLLWFFLQNYFHTCHNLFRLTLWNQGRRLTYLLTIQPFYVLYKRIVLCWARVPTWLLVAKSRTYGGVLYPNEISKRGNQGPYCTYCTTFLRPFLEDRPRFPRAHFW